MVPLCSDMQEKKGERGKSRPQKKKVPEKRWRRCDERARKKCQSRPSMWAEKKKNQEADASAVKEFKKDPDPQPKRIQKEGRTQGRPTPEEA